MITIREILAVQLIHGLDVLTEQQILQHDRDAAVLGVTIRHYGTYVTMITYSHQRTAKETNRMQPNGSENVIHTT